MFISTVNSQGFDQGVRAYDQHRETVLRPKIQAVRAN